MTDAPAKAGRTREHRALVGAVALGVVLTAVKFVAWRLTGSSGAPAAPALAMNTSRSWPGATGTSSWSKR